MVGVAADDRVGEQAGSGESALDGEDDRVGDVKLGRVEPVAVLSEVLQPANPTVHERRRAALERREHLLADALEVLQPDLQDLVGDDLDVNDGQMLGEGSAPGWLRAPLRLGCLLGF